MEQIIERLGRLDVASASDAMDKLAYRVAYLEFTLCARISISAVVHLPSIMYQMA